MGFMSTTSAPLRSLHFKGISAAPSLPKPPKSCKPQQINDGCITISGHACSYWMPIPIYRYIPIFNFCEYIYIYIYIIIDIV